MPIYDWNGSVNSEIGTIYDNNGSVNAQIDKVYDNNGTTNSLIYQNKPAPMSKTLTVSTVQGANKYNSNTTTFSVPDGYTTITITNFTPGQSYGICYTEVWCAGNELTCMRNFFKRYTGSGFTTSEQITPITTMTKNEGIIEISIVLKALYDPNVSGQHTSTASVAFTLS